MNAPRPGSRKSRVHKAFTTGGSEAAIAEGVELKLKPGTVRSWINTWQKGPTEPTIKSATLPGRKQSKRIKLTKWALGPKFDGALGTLIHRSGATGDPFTVRLDDGSTFDVRDYEFEYVETRT